jgi:hypothetical protein
MPACLDGTSNPINSDTRGALVNSLRRLAIDVRRLFRAKSHVVDRGQLSGNERADNEFTGGGEVDAVGESQCTLHIVHDCTTSVVAALRGQEMPHRLERDAGRGRGHLTVNGVQRPKTLAVTLGRSDGETDPERVRTCLDHHSIDPSNPRDVVTTPLRRTERLRHSMDTECLFVVRAKHDDDEIGMVRVQVRLQMGRPVVKPRRGKTRRRLVALDQFQSRCELKLVSNAVFEIVTE